MKGRLKNRFYRFSDDLFVVSRKLNRINSLTAFCVYAQS